MKRRTLVRRLGAAGIATTTLSGSTAATEGRSVTDLDIDRRIDVSSVEGPVTLDELLEPRELADLPAGVDSTEQITVAPEADVITLGHCCDICCEDQVFKDCTCSCCVCNDAICFGDGDDQ